MIFSGYPLPAFKAICTAVTCLMIQAQGGLLSAQATQPSLSVETNRPELNIFIPGETVELTFRAQNMPADNAALALEVDVADWTGASVNRWSVPVAVDADGNWTQSFPLKAEDKGQFSVYARLSNGVTILPQGTRPGSFITYGVTFDPRQRTLYPQSKTFFGMQGRAGGNIPLAAYMGIRWVLGDGRWVWNEPNYPGQFAERMERQRSANKLPLERRYETTWAGGVWQEYPVFHLMGGNSSMPQKWKESLYHKNTKAGWGELTEEGEKYFADYCRAFVRAIVESYPDYENRYYEVLWEPELHYLGTDEGILRFFQIAYPIIHELDERAIVMGPNLAGLNPRSLDLSRRLLGIGLGDYIDAFSIHPYTPVNTTTAGLAWMVRELRGMIRDAVGRDLPLLGTEYGKSNSASNLEEMRALTRLIIRQNATFKGEGFAFNMNFFAVDNSTSFKSRTYGLNYNLDGERSYGPLRVSPKPQAMAYAAMSWLLEGSEVIGPVDWLGENVFGYAFEKDNEIILMFWTDEGTQRNIALPVGTSRVTVYDLMGNATPVDCHGEQLQLAVGASPQYVVGAAAAIWGADAARKIVLGNESLALFPGETKTVSLLVSAADGLPLRGEVSTALNPRLTLHPSRVAVDLQAGQSKSFDFTITAAVDAPVGFERMDFILSRANSVVDGAGQSIEILPLVTAGALMPVINPDGTRAVMFELTENRGQALLCTVGLTVAGQPTVGGQTTVELAGGETRMVRIPVAAQSLNPARKYNATLRVSVDNGYAIEVPGMINFLTAERAEAPVQVGSDSTEWEAATVVTLAGKEFCVRNPAAYSGDSAEIRYLWDDNALYLRVVVNDAAHVQDNPGALTWMDDSVQCGFVLEPWKQATQTSNDLADEANRPLQTEIVLALTKNGAEAYRTLSAPAGDGWANGALDQVACPLSITHKNGQTIYEAVFPWATLGLREAPAAHTHLGVTIAVNDRDAPTGKGAITETSTLSLFDGATNRKDPGLMGILLLND